MYGKTIQRDQLVITKVADDNFIENAVLDAVNKVVSEMSKRHGVKFSDETYRMLYMYSQQFTQSISDTIVSSIPREPLTPPYNVGTY